MVSKLNLNSFKKELGFLGQKSNNTNQLTPFDYNFDYAIKTTPLGTTANSSNYIPSTLYKTTSTELNSSNFTNNYYQIANNNQIVQVRFFH